jgi:anti-sigma B factor antagonist
VTAVEVIFLRICQAARVGTGSARSDKTPDEGWPCQLRDSITTSVEHRGGVAVVSIGGEIDLSTAPAFEAVVAEALAEDPPVLVIELSEVTFMASVGLRILAATQEKVGKSIQLAVVADHAAASRPMQLTGLDNLISLYPTVDEALTALGQAACD